MRLGFVGAGNMASALARGIGEPVLVHDLDETRAQALADAVGGEVVGSNAELAERADAIVLAHKPPQLEDVAAQVGAQARTVVSILAATPTERIEAAYPDAAVYRFIPNIPVEVHRGVLCYVPGSRAEAAQEADILALMERVGTVFRLADEALIEPAMAIMSCGPAFWALLAEAFAKAGAAYGLDPADAARMTAETMGGTAAWLDAHEQDAAGLRARVATPGGATERGLKAMDAAGARAVCRAAVDAVMAGIKR
jgi:pyrroline-5-carboxylate reductase